MKKISQILINNHVFIFFIILEIISIKIYVDNNFLQKNRFNNIVLDFRGNLFKKQAVIIEYFNLKQENYELLKQNQILVAEINNTKTTYKSISIPKKIHKSSNDFTQAHVVRNSWNKKRNFLTLDVGEKDGIRKNMGVISGNGLVGIVNNTSDNFSTVISSINIDLMISAKVKSTGHFGSLIWDGNDPSILNLVDIPKHCQCNIGDTIITSGYSNIFPANINIGYIKDLQAIDNTNFLNISIKLFTDFTKIKYAYILSKKRTSERTEIENKIKQ